MEGRRERKKRQTREAIMETAFRLFAERGFDAVTIAEIAAAADVAVNTIFNHFKTKEELFFSAFKPPGESLAERLLARAPGRSPVSCLQELLAESFDQLEAPTSWPALAVQNCQFRTVLEGSPSLHAQAIAAFRKRRMELLTEVSEALAHPLAPDALSRLVANQLLALQDGVVMEIEYRRRSGEPPTALARAVRPAAERACAMLEAGLGGYGVR